MSGPVRSARWLGRRVIQADGTRIGTFAAIYNEEPGRSWGLVRERRFGGRRRCVPLDDARSTDAGIVVPYSREVVHAAPAIAPGAPDPREAERLAVYYGEVDGTSSEDAEDVADPGSDASAPAVAESSPELAEALAEARYCDERLSLYRAKRYRGAAVSDSRMRELERARDGAQAQLRRIRDRAAGGEPGPPPQREGQDSTPGGNT